MHLPTAIGIMASLFLSGIFIGYIIGRWERQLAFRAAIKVGQLLMFWNKLRKRRGAP